MKSRYMYGFALFASLFSLSLTGCERETETEYRMPEGSDRSGSAIRNDVDKVEVEEKVEPDGDRKTDVDVDR